MPTAGTFVLLTTYVHTVVLSNDVTGIVNHSTYHGVMYDKGNQYYS